LNLIYDESMDAERYKIYFNEISSETFGGFFNNIFTGLKIDLMFDLIAFFVSIFTDNQYVFFMILSLLIGWMVMKNTKIIYTLYSQHKTHVGIVFLIFFLILFMPSRVLSFRHYFALLVYIYAVYNYLDNGNKKYIILIFS